MTQILRQSTQIKVVIGPVVAVGDGFTPVTTLALGTADEAEIIKSDAAAVTDISGATFAAITSADGYYNLTLSTSHTDTVGLLTVLINDDSLCLPVKATFQVVEEAIYDALFAASATGLLPANVTQFGGTNGTFSGGRPEVNASHWAGAATATNDVALATAPTNFASFAITAAGGVTLADGVTHGGSTADFEARDMSVAGTTNFVGAFIADDAGNQIKGIDSFTTAGKAELQQEATDALNAYDPPTKAEMDTGLDALPTAAENADAVWDEDATAHQTQGTFGQAIGDPGADSDSIWALANTNLNATVGSRASQASVDDIPTNSDLTTALANLDAAVSTRATPAQVATELATYDGPTNAEMEARTLVAASYATASALSTAQNDLTQIKADLPTRPTKNTALANFPFVMRLSSDHVTGATGKTVTATRSLDGAAFASCANSVSEVANGVYKISLAAGDLNGDTVTLRFTATDCDDTIIVIATQP